MAQIDHIPRHYEPATREAETYSIWEKSGAFRADPDPSKKPYTVVMPPPNITGQLHMGHALNNSLQDIFIRWRRMQGYAVLWQPGTDHASIATEARIVDELAGEGISKYDLGREGFLERAWEWKERYGGRITEQLRRLGCSCDWERMRFTMDDGLSEAVRLVFVRLYEKGLIYRGLRMINWCPTCATTISDIEVVHEERDTWIWTIRYPLCPESDTATATDSSDPDAPNCPCLLVATTRPETLLGDTAVAVNPDDERYRALVGRYVELPLCNRRIPIVADNYVEPEFGTGVVKITPAHDPNDYEVALRHDLPSVNMLTPDAHVEAGFGRYSGMPSMEARAAVLEDLEQAGLLAKREPYRHAVGTCQRCGTTVEPRPMEQWFVHMKPLAAPAIDAVRDGRIRFVPDRFERVYEEWMKNIQDWCISRQLWWGHRIPAWYCGDCGRITVSMETPGACAHCGSAQLEQDPDTLDTWFSSALWPFSTLGWPHDTPELKRHYPTDDLITGYDIIFFWVARMIFSGLEQMGEIPFHTVLMNGIVRDAQGRKMSKSLDNGIDPLDIIDRFGTDALRYALITGTAPGGDQRFSEALADAGRNFVNKLWNASRFVLMQLPENVDLSHVEPTLTNLEDRWILSELDHLTREVTGNLERYESGLALAKVYSFIWESYCDWYIEIAKLRLASAQTAAESLATCWVLVTVLERALRLLHPFMPFVTEALHELLPPVAGTEHSELLITARWPEAQDAWCDEQATREMEQFMEAVRRLRNLRAEYQVKSNRLITLHIQTADAAYERLFRENESLLVSLVRLAELVYLEPGAGFAADTVQIALPGATLAVPLGELVDREAERERIARELAGSRERVLQLEAKLRNEAFTSRAPAPVVEREREKLARELDLIATLEAQQAALA
ncbi:MAG: valine--tRNA ligase [Bacillota bacterium]|nr:valine--tRNA ligase [Bacillota bacterium]